MLGWKISPVDDAAAGVEVEDDDVDDGTLLEGPGVEPGPHGVFLNYHSCF